MILGNSTGAIVASIVAAPRLRSSAAVLLPPEVELELRLLLAWATKKECFLQRPSWQHQDYGRLRQQNSLKEIRCLTILGNKGLKLASIMVVHGGSNTVHFLINR
jgi:hypothetical protein